VRGKSFLPYLLMPSDMASPVGSFSSNGRRESTVGNFRSLQPSNSARLEMKRPTLMTDVLEPSEVSLPFTSPS
jgi:hypothetical protein